MSRLTLHSSLVTTLLALSPATGAAQPYRPFESGAEVSAYLDQASRRIAATRGRGARGALLTSLVQEMKAREAVLPQPRSSADTHTGLSVAYAAGALELIPAPPLTRKACAGAEDRIILGFDPPAAKSDGKRMREPMLPASVEAVLRVLKAVCRR